MGIENTAPEPTPASAGFVDQYQEFDRGAEGGFSNLRIHAHVRHELRHQVKPRPSAQSVSPHYEDVMGLRRILRMSRCGGAPNRREYSRLNCEALS